MINNQKTKRASAKPWLLALLISLSVAGLSRWLFLADQSYSGRYFVAVSVTMFVIMLQAVVVSVWQERAALAAPFVVLAASLTAVIFYASELSSSFILAETVICAVALASWLLATIGSALRKRLRQMD